MANTVVLKRSAVQGRTPTTGDLALGEIAINTYDGNLFFKKSVSGTDTVLSVATLTGTQTLTNKTLASPTITGTAVFSAIGGDEGGEIQLATAATNNTLSGGSVTIDIWQNNLRIFESGGSNRGVSLNLASTSNGVGSGLVTTNGTQTLTNKTLTSPTINSATANNLTLTGTLTAGGGTGTNGQILASTGTGVQWISNTTSNLDSLTDVVISSPTSDQVLKYNGTVWINAESDTAVASAVFAANAESDLGSVTDLIIGLTEDLGLVTDTPATYIYNLGSLVVDGIVSLNNLDQSVKADYIAYSIIFGF